LDGIRGLLVFPVVAFHFSIIGGGSTLAPGSFFAPSMFFTLSGFLITSLLIIERERKGRVNWAGFWSRRFRRLLPASLTVVLVAACLPLVWKGAWGVVPPSDILAAIFSAKNWQSIALVDTPQAMRLLGPLSPFWSLSLEEQFYLGLSLVVGVSMLSQQWRRWLFWLLIVAGAGSVLTQVLMHAGPNREFFGTDTRAAELVAGCLLALAIDRWGWPTSRWWVVAGWASLAITVVAWGWVNESDPWVLSGGLSAFSIVDVVMICGAVVAGGSFGRVMSFRPFVEIGKLSYPIYLVHWPVALAMRPDYLGFRAMPLTIARFAVSLAIAWPLARWVEAPIRTRRVLKGYRFAVAWAVVTVLAVGVSMWLQRSGG
jgi:peptidoglycan/LPS O-acetylase OafA/YrhL